MLSFWSEQGSDNGLAETPDAKTTNPDSATSSQNYDRKPVSFKQMPLQSDIQEYFAISAQNKNVRQSTYLLAILLGMGLLCLWFMIKKSSPQTSIAATVKTEQTHIEAAIAQLLGARLEMFEGIEKIVKKFYQFSNVQQVPVNELLKNPFKHEIFRGVHKKDWSNEQIDPRLNYQTAKQLWLKQQAENMQLFTIMQSQEGICCMIDDKILYEGDVIKGFRISQISNNYVKLESEGLQILLKLSE